MTDNQRAPEIKAAFSFDEFCRRNSISRRTLCNLLDDGIGPRTLKLRGRRLITAAAEADWHRERESGAAAAIRPPVKFTRGRLAASEPADAEPPESRGENRAG